jgi:glycosyltransferase involved in cell wall biosynthesis
MRLLIAIPVFNERNHVAGVLAKVRKYRHDVLVVDDASTDGTGKVLDDLAKRGQIHLIRHSSNLGYGQSLIDAFGFAKGHGYDWVITMDCDEQHEPERIPEFVRQIALDDADIISGSRYLESSATDDAPPPDRRKINARLTALINDRLGLNLTDAFCGYKAHRVSALRKLHLDESGYAFPMQLWPQVAAAHLRVKEIPVRLIYNDPNRHFGGTLDDPDNRLRHYLAVLEAQIHRTQTTCGTSPSAASTCCCGF